MAGTANFARGGMDIHGQKSTFSHFLGVSLWGTLLIIMGVALATLAFAMGLGWWAGLAAYGGIGVLAGLAVGMKSGWWMTVIGSTILLGLGGLVSLLF